MKNIAILSPSKNIYSETFITNHKKIINHNIYFYYGGFLPLFLEKEGMLKASFFNKLIFIIRSIFRENLDYNVIINSESLIRSLKRNKIDLVFAEYGPTGAEVLGICKKAKIPLIVNFHGADASEKSLTETYKLKYLDMFGYASAIIAVSKEMVKTLTCLGCPPEKVHYITYGPSDIFLELEPSFEEDMFLSVGRFVDKKSPYNLILAFEKVCVKYPDAKLYMAGDGPLLQTCINLTNQLKLQNNITFCGVLTPEEVASLMQKSRAFVQHSIEARNGDKEGTPVAIIESQAAGIPAISTYHAGIPDIVIHKKTGFLVEENDINSMANYMIELLGDKDQAIKMGKHAKENVKNNYSMKIHSNKINDLINQFCKPSIK